MLTDELAQNRISSRAFGDSLYFSASAFSASFFAFTVLPSTVFPLPVAPFFVPCIFSEVVALALPCVLELDLDAVAFFALTAVGTQIPGVVENPRRDRTRKGCLETFKSVGARCTSRESIDEETVSTVTDDDKDVGGDKNVAIGGDGSTACSPCTCYIFGSIYRYPPARGCDSAEYSMCHRDS